MGIEKPEEIKNKKFKEWYDKSKNNDNKLYKYEGDKPHYEPLKIEIKPESTTGGRRRKSKKKQRKTRKQSKLRKNKSKRSYK